MAPQDWISPDSTAYHSTLAAPPLRPAPAYDLRPLAVGEILDRVLSIYRSHFWLLVGLSALSAGVAVGVQVLHLIYMYFTGTTLASPSYSLSAVGFMLVEVVLYLIAYSLTLAATTSAVNAIYLGEPTSMGSALHTARRLWPRCLGVALWQGWSASWAFMFLAIPVVVMVIPGMAGTSTVLLGSIVLILGMIACVVYGVIAYLRNSLAIPAAVIEDLGVRTAMRRSKNLATGRIGRIFLMLLLTYALSLVAAVIQMPTVFVLLRSPQSQHYGAQAIALAVNFASTSMVGPVAAIGFCLFYFDERVRREGFDIEMMLRDASAVSPPPPSTPVVSPDPPDISHPSPEQT